MAAIASLYSFGNRGGGGNSDHDGHGPGPGGGLNFGGRGLFKKVRIGAQLKNTVGWFGEGGSEDQYGQDGLDGKDNFKEKDKYVFIFPPDIDGSQFYYNHNML